MKYVRESSVIIIVTLVFRTDEGIKLIFQRGVGFVVWSLLPVLYE
jgi:hypothetical protein